jgi:hypothetical protein
VDPLSPSYSLGGGWRGLLLSIAGLHELLGAARLDLEVEIVPRGVHDDLVARLNGTAEHHPRQLVLDAPLDRPPEGTRAELRIEAPLASSRTASSRVADNEAARPFESLPVLDPERARLCPDWPRGPVPGTSK